MAMNPHVHGCTCNWIEPPAETPDIYNWSIAEEDPNCPIHGLASELTPEPNEPHVEQDPNFIEEGFIRIHIGLDKDGDPAFGFISNLDVARAIGVLTVTLDRFKDQAASTWAARDLFDEEDEEEPGPDE